MFWLPTSGYLGECYLYIYKIDVFLFGFYGPFKNISLISSRSFIKDGQKPESPGKNHLTTRKQNLAFPHVTRVRLEPQRWETKWIKSQLSYPLGYGGPPKFMLYVGLQGEIYERALRPHILLFLLISISKFRLTISKFRHNKSKFRLNNSKFRLNNSKFRRNILKFQLIISKFRHKISKFRRKFRHNKSKFRLNNSKFRLSNSKFRLKILKFRLNNSKCRLNNSKFRLNILKFRLIILKFRHKISWIEFTPGNLVRGSRWLYNQNLYASFWPWLTRHPNINKRIHSPDSLIFRKFQTYFESKGCTCWWPGHQKAQGLQSDLKTWNCMFMLSYRGLYRQDTQFNLHPYWNKIEYLHAMTND